ncbi:hypothetical protein T4B_8208 [Trichinella pseudospiralis]|uniref:Uncharacterized protein n=1 Tax=Trichinella pseudospiralis TaxID=6337 RepID=A0A0V1IGF9_TRIPS|nr:hypothetical protein T4B_8208 [Trichinella pseudospiralis]KRZ35209.1 hypothetical protein T4C_807 [Trichinella pseudospiralis]
MTLAKQCRAEAVIMVYGGRWSTLKFNCSKMYWHRAKTSSLSRNLISEAYSRRKIITPQVSTQGPLAEKKRQAGRQAGSKAGKEEEEEEEEEELYKWGGARPKKIQIQPQDRYLGDMVTEEWMGTPSRIHCPTMKAILDQLDHLDRQNIAAHQAEQSFVKAELIVNLLTGSSGGGGGGLRHFQHDHAFIQLLQNFQIDPRPTCMQESCGRRRCVQRIFISILNVLITSTVARKTTIRKCTFD